MASRRGIQIASRYVYRYRPSSLIDSTFSHAIRSSFPSTSNDGSRSQSFSTFNLGSRDLKPSFLEHAQKNYSFPSRNYSAQASAMQNSMPNFSNLPQMEERPYARDINEYNQAMFALCKRRKAFLVREVYEDMLLDGIQPNRDTFHIAIPGLMRANKLQDAFFFFNEMKANGLVPDIVLYNSMISTCGRCLQVDRAFQVAEEMEAMGIQPKFRTFVALLNACGLSGRVNEAYGVVRRMTTSGLSMNKYCYSALITAYKNRRPVFSETITKIFDLLEQSKSAGGKDEVLLNATLGENDDLDFAEEQGLATEIQARRGFLNRNLIVYHATLRAMTDLRNFKGADRVLQLMKDDGLYPDAYTYTQIMKLNLTRFGDLNKALEAFDSFVATGAAPTLDLYLTMIEGCIKTFSSKGMDAAKKLLTEMFNKGYFLNPRIGAELLGLASKELGGDYSVACMIFDALGSDKRPLFLPPVISFLRGLLKRRVPEDDPRVIKAREIVSSRFPNFTYTPNINNSSSNTSTDKGNAHPESDGAGMDQGYELGAESDQAGSSSDSHDGAFHEEDGVRGSQDFVSYSTSLDSEGPTNLDAGSQPTDGSMSANPL